MVTALERPPVKIGERVDTLVSQPQESVLLGDTALHDYLWTETGSLRTYTGSLERLVCDNTGCMVTLREGEEREVTKKLNGKDLEPTLNMYIGGEAFGSSTVFGDRFVLLSVNPPEHEIFNESGEPQRFAAD